MSWARAADIVMNWMTISTLPVVMLASPDKLTFRNR